MTHHISAHNSLQLVQVFSMRKEFGVTITTLHVFLNSMQVCAKLFDEFLKIDNHKQMQLFFTFCSDLSSMHDGGSSISNTSLQVEFPRSGGSLWSSTFELCRIRARIIRLFLNQKNFQITHLELLTVTFDYFCFNSWPCCHLLLICFFPLGQIVFNGFVPRNQL